MIFRLMLLFLISAVPVRADDLGTINFDFDSDRLDAEALAEVERIAAKLGENPLYGTLVVGYTDAVGTTGYNFDLARRRAENTARALTAAGVPVSRIDGIQSKGETELLVAVTGPERLNRRVTVTLDDILAACRNFRQINITQASLGEALQEDLIRRATTARNTYAQLAASGGNGPAFQMAGAAREDCGSAVGYGMNERRKIEYSQRCLCSSARLSKALGN
ncbi:OmpA family protein [Rhodobacteraceae bacterium KN286]|uniref:OmpA family protein n=1 Tax=Oceanomicrobium pacificus TaxID=2692916 RepID=A0A6B0TY81_9RHOB|nr:OmpA family protein [Oceanomicrobium pacificus]